jgi:hypothetical protein
LTLDAGNLFFPNNSLKAAYQNFTINSVGNIASGDFPVTKDAFYRLQFKSAGLKNSNLEFDVTQNVSPFKSAEVGKSFLIQNSLSNQEYIFKSNANFTNARIQFYSTIYDSTSWIDEVVLMQVQADTNASTPCQNSPIFVNPTSAKRSIILSGSFKTLEGIDAGSSLTLPPFSSKILTKTINGIKNGNGNLLDDPDALFKQTGLIISPVPTAMGHTILVKNTELSTEWENAVRYTVCSQSGLIYKSGTSSPNEFKQLEINTSGLTEGIWYLKIANGSDTWTEKFILF